MVLTDILKSKDINTLWKQIKNFKRPQKVNNIEGMVWVEYYRNLLNDCRNDVQKDFQEMVDTYYGSHFDESTECGPLNETISTYEIKNVVNQMPSGKSPGPDGFSLDIIKHVFKFILPFLVKLFKLSLLKVRIPECYQSSSVSVYNCLEMFIKDDNLVI